PLLAVAVPRRALEELHLAGGGELVVGVERDRGHAALVRLVRPVDIEVAKARDLRGLPRQRAAHQLVEQELGVAIDVERALAGALLAELGARTGDRRRRGVQQRDLGLLAPVEQRLRIAVVVLHHVAPVELHRVGARALVKHRLHRAVEAVQALQELALVEEIGDLQAREVRHFGRAAEVVDGDDVGDAGAVQRLDDPGADESGGPGDYVVHGQSFSPVFGLSCARLRCSPKSSAWVATAVPSLPTTMPAARLARRIAGSMPAPAASTTARVAITVSPAPVTSNTSASRATAGIVVVLFLANKVIPCSPRVRRSASRPSLSRMAWARALRSFSSFQVPTTRRSSSRFGVITLTPL